MNRASLAGWGGVLLVLALVWSVSEVRSDARRTQRDLPVVTAPATAQGESASIAVRGILTARARTSIVHRNGGGRYLLIVLRARDRRVCEDLGRQLRETLRAASGRFRPVLVTEDSAAGDYRAFARREHLNLPVVPLPLDSLIRDRSLLPTPAVLANVGAEGLVEGVAHPARFANVRSVSFAAEMHTLLSGDTTGK
ncbi:MAG TPA: hypothetical protein VFS20_17035 [Longimicrobium sp.]|nr:hypothetical protein [Longimicrobium sp.]